MGTGEKLTMPIFGLGCDGCVVAVENALNRLPGVSYAGVSLIGATLTLRIGEGFDHEELVRCIDALGYSVSGSVSPSTDDLPCPCRSDTW